MLRWVFFTAVVCGCVKTDPVATDAGAGGTADAGPAPKILHITGTVELPYLSSATNVAIVARCGPREVNTTTDANGAYELTVDTDGCAPLVLTMTKERYLPAVRRIGLPLGKAELQLKTVLLELKQLSCNDGFCAAEGYDFTRFPAGPMTRGWVATMGGPRALDDVGGALRDQNGDLLWATGFAYFDLRDDSGAPLTEFAPFDQCVRVDFDAVDWLVDAVPSTDQVEQMTYVLEADRGRWTRRDSYGYLSYTADTATDANGYPYDVVERVNRSQLDFIRTGQFTAKLWLCGRVDRSGWLAFGVPMPRTSCLRITTRDSCNNALTNSAITAVGSGYGFVTGAWTDQTGATCIELARSEPAGEDYDYDGDKGETYFVDLTAISDIRYERIESQQVPREAGSCAQPASCTPLDIQFQTFQTCD